jgi:hypothetical protein
MFVCGPNEPSGKPAVYSYSTTSCCAQGIRFNPSTQMCCYDGVHDTADGFCAPWWDEFPTQCYCPWDLKSTLNVTLSSADHAVIDTRIRPSNPCHYAGSQAGCYNGYEFDSRSRCRAALSASTAALTVAAPPGMPSPPTT